MEPKNTDFEKERILLNLLPHLPNPQLINIPRSHHEPPVQERGIR